MEYNCTIYLNKTNNVREYVVKGVSMSNDFLSIFNSFNTLLIISGVRFRRQHWCLLSIILLIIVLGIAIGLHMNSSKSDDSEGESGDLTTSEDNVQVSIPTTEEARMKAVKQMLKEVPLIDG